MKNDEFIALAPGLLRHPAKTISRRHRQAAPGADASAFQGRLSAQVALLQSPILPAANPAYPQQRKLYNVPVDNTHTRLRRGSRLRRYERAAGDAGSPITPKTAKSQKSLYKWFNHRDLYDPQRTLAGYALDLPAAVRGEAQEPIDR